MALRTGYPDRISKKSVQKYKMYGYFESDRKTRRRPGNLLDDLNERRGYSHLKEEALERNMWSVRFGRGFGPVVRQNTE
jgi:hypothetical protein